MRVPEAPENWTAMMNYWAEKVLDKALTIVVAASLAMSVGLVTGLKNKAVELWELPETVQTQLTAMNIEQQKIRADIAALRNPKKIFEVSPSLSHAIDGQCVQGQPCDFEVVARRTPEGSNCQIITGLTEYWLVSLVNNLRYTTTRVGNAVEGNIGTDWTPIQVTINTPRTIPAGEAHFLFMKFYMKCTDDQGIEPIRSTSEPILVNIAKS